MKNSVKKFTAAAMAFTILGAGTATIKKIAPKTDNSITVHAMSAKEATENNNKVASWGKRLINIICSFGGPVAEGVKQEANTYIDITTAQYNYYNDILASVGY